MIEDDDLYDDYIFDLAKMAQMAWLRSVAIGGNKGGGAPAVPVAPVLTWDTPSSDNTPQFTVALMSPSVDDVVTFQIDTVSDFSSASSTPDTVDAGEVTASEVTFTLAELADGTYYTRAKVTQDGVDSDWSDTVEVTISTAAPITGIVFEGDSITAEPVNGVTWPMLLAARAGFADPAVNRATAGQTVNGNMLPDYATDVQPYLTGDYNTLVMEGGTNDLGNFRTDTQLITDLRSYASTPKAAGKLVAQTTILPRNVAWDATKETYRTNVNTTIRGDQGTYYDYVVDFAAIAAMADPADTTVYQDGLHPTELGLEHLVECAMSDLGLSVESALRFHPRAVRANNNPTFSNNMRRCAPNNSSIVTMETAISGKVAFGFTFSTKDGAAWDTNFIAMGLSRRDATAGGGFFGQTTGSAGWIGDGRIFYSGDTGFDSGISWVKDRQYVILVDASSTTKKTWLVDVTGAPTVFRGNSTTNLTGTDVAAGTGGYDVTALLAGGTTYPAVGLVFGSNGDFTIIQSVPAGLTLPTGFSWLAPNTGTLV